MDNYSRKSWSQQLWFVAPLTVVILIIAACSSSDDPVSPASIAPAPAPTTTAATAAAPTTSGNAQSLTDEEALAVSGEFVDAFNSGDADAVLALFTSNVALSEKYTGMTDWGPIDRAFFEQHLVWSTAQGTTFTSPECAVTDDSAGAEVTVSCEFGWLYAAEKAAGAPPVPTVLAMVVTPDGISEAAFEYPPEFGLVRFDNWLFLNHKEDSQGVEYGDWNSVAEAQQGGTLRAQYVAEWAADLEASSG
jgi:hypothetical protein